jgi:hypothetical protein
VVDSDRSAEFCSDGVIFREGFYTRSAGQIVFNPFFGIALAMLANNPCSLNLGRSFLARGQGQMNAALFDEPSFV